MFNNIFYCFYIEIYNEKYYFLFLFCINIINTILCWVTTWKKNPRWEPLLSIIYCSLQIHKHNFGSLWLQIMLGWEVKEGREK